MATLALALAPVLMHGQAPGPPDEVVWHWFGGCEGGDSLAVEVRLDGKSLYASSFPICQVRRSEIRPEQPQRVLKFQFYGKTGRFAPEYRTSGKKPIEGNIWEAGGERDAVLLGVSFATDRRVLHGQFPVVVGMCPPWVEVVGEARPRPLHYGGFGQGRIRRFGHALGIYGPERAESGGRGQRGGSG